MRLRKVISGGQVGADIAGLRAAKAFGLETGGVLPLGWRTLKGPRPEYSRHYGCTEHKSPQYPPRTFQNVRDSDGTLRLALNWQSAGEQCTLKAIRQYRKHWLDIEPFDSEGNKKIAEWLWVCQIEVLNVAGNANEAIEFSVEQMLLSAWQLLRERTS